MNIDFEQLPPGAEVRMTAHLGLDVLSRAGTVPADVDVGVVIDGGGVSSGHVVSSREFPIWSTGVISPQARVLEDGTYRSTLSFSSCFCGTVEPHYSECVLHPESTLTVDVVDTRPWRDAPPCE